MKLKKKTFIWMSLFIFLTVLVCYFFYFFKNEEEVKSSGFVSNNLEEYARDLQKIWYDGEDSKEWNLISQKCLKYFGIKNNFDSTLLRCNPMLIECHALFSKNLNYQVLKQKNNFNNEKFYKYITKSNFSHYGIEDKSILISIKDLKSKESLRFSLEDNCREVYLEKRIYTYSLETPFLFDNLNLNISFDKTLVTNFEINEWIEFGNIQHVKNLKLKSGDDLFLPALDLTLEQMNNYCSFKGKQLMLAHFFDAASFMPFDYSDIKPKKEFKGPYYWLKKKSEFTNDCNKIYTKNCLESNVQSDKINGPTWAGLMGALGGYLEVVRNPIDIESNLKASSFYFKNNSLWHRLGVRAQWDGEDFNFKNFDFKGIPPEINYDHFQVGFRCMREVI